MRTIVIDGVQIPEHLIAREAQNHPGASAADAWRAAGHALAVKALLLDRARTLGIGAECETDEAGREETPQEALVRAVLEAEVEAHRPTPEECHRYYEARRDRFRTPELYEAAHILFSVEDEAQVQAARIAAEQALAVVLAAPERFAELAGSLSDCPSAALGGSLGQLTRGDLAPEVETALLSLAPGAIAQAPVRSRFGWHVLLLVRRIEGRLRPFEQVAEAIGLHLEGRAWTAAAARYVAELSRRAREAGAAVVLVEEDQLARPAPTLGGLLSRADSAERLAPWLGDADPDLLQRTSKAAEEAGAQFPDFVRVCVGDFIAEADDEAWTQLISRAQGAEDPALAGLKAILERRLGAVRRMNTVIRRKS